MWKGKCKAIHTYFWLRIAVLMSQFWLYSQKDLATVVLTAFAHTFIHLLLGADPAESCSLNLW